MIYRTCDLFDFSHSIAADYLELYEYPWQALAKIGDLVLELGRTLDKAQYDEVSEGVWVHKTADVAPTAFIEGPCIIGEGAKVRHCAYIRGKALIGANCVVGNSTELKNVILFDNVQVPHFNYVGDSILGFHAHLGAGVKISNFKAGGSNVTIRDVDGDMETGLRKCGAMLGDYADIGCNAVLNPGTIIGRNTTVYPLSNVRGTVEQGCIYKSADNIVCKE